MRATQAERRQHTLRRFARLRDQALALYPGLKVGFRWNAKAGDGRNRRETVGCNHVCQDNRAFAWCFRADKHLQIEASPRLAAQGRGRQEGVLRHELGHAILLHLGHDRHTEAEADRAAEVALGKPISYDEDLVQTVGEGHRPRPPALDERAPGGAQRQNAGMGNQAVVHHSAINWSLFRASETALARIRRSSEIRTLGQNGAGDHVYELVGTPYRLYYKAFPKATAAGKIGQIYVQRAP